VTSDDELFNLYILTKFTFGENSAILTNFIMYGTGYDMRARNVHVDIYINRLIKFNLKKLNILYTVLYTRYTTVINVRTLVLMDALVKVLIV